MDAAGLLPEPKRITTDRLAVHYTSGPPPGETRPSMYRCPTRVSKARSLEAGLVVSWPAALTSSTSNALRHLFTENDGSWSVYT